MSRLRRVTASALLVLPLGLFAAGRPRLVHRPAAEEVVNYRGGAPRDGVYRGAGPRTQPALLWQRTLGGSTYAGSVHHGGTLYAGDSQGRLRAIDAATGAVKWTSVAEAIASPPSVTADAVYATSALSFIYALDKTSGQTLWSIPTRSPMFAAPLVTGGVLYAGSEAGDLFAIDVATHTEKWRYRGPREIHTQPALAADTVVFGSGPVLIALDAATGIERWRFDSGTLAGGISIANGTVYAVVDPGHLFAFDLYSGNVLWHVPPAAGVNGWTTLAVFNGLVYGGNNLRRLVALDAFTGETRWTFDAADVPSDPIVADGVLYFGTWSPASSGTAERRVYALDTATGAQLWSAVVTGDVQAGPAVGEGIVFFTTTGGKVYAFQ